MLSNVNDERLRRKGWDVWRSSTRDRMVPMAGLGRRLLQIKIKQALPAQGVDVGGTAISEAERAAAAKSRDTRLDQLKAQLQAGGGHGLSQGFHVTFRNQAPGVLIPGGETYISAEAFTVPFDGYIRQLAVYIGTGFPNSGNIAVRMSSGMTLFVSQGNSIFANPFDQEPDTVDGSTPDFIAQVVRNAWFPVRAGDQMSVGWNAAAGIGAGLLGATVVFMLETSDVAPQSIQIATASLSNVNREYAEVSDRARVLTAQLEIEKEKTKRAQVEANARIVSAQELAKASRPAGMPMVNPFNFTLSDPRAQSMVQSRQPVSVPEPAFGAPSAPAGGAGKTFVASWMPQVGAIGYLIPDPPRGGRVNVFGDTYTIWDISGRKVGEGKVELVRSDADIPAESRISRNLGVAPSGAIRSDQAAILASRAGGSAFG